MSKPLKPIWEHWPKKGDLVKIQCKDSAFSGEYRFVKQVDYECRLFKLAADTGRCFMLATEQIEVMIPVVSEEEAGEE